MEPPQNASKVEDDNKEKTYKTRGKRWKEQSTNKRLGKQNESDSIISDIKSSKKESNQKDMQPILIICFVLLPIVFTAVLLNRQFSAKFNSTGIEFSVNPTQLEIKSK